MRTSHEHQIARFIRRVGSVARDESGQAVVEFALVAALLLILVFGIAQFGLALNTANDESQLAGEAARFAATNYNPGTGSFVSWVKSQSDNTLLANNSTVCINITTPGGGTPTPGASSVTVSVTTNFGWQPLSGLTGSVLPSTLTETATMRLEAVPTNYATGCA